MLNIVPLHMIGTDDVVRMTLSLSTNRASRRPMSRVSSKKIWKSKSKKTSVSRTVMTNLETQEASTAAMMEI